MAVAVVTDSTQYLPPELIAAQGIDVVSLYVKRGESLERESELLDDLAGYYGRLREASDLPTTSQPSVGDFLACYEPLLQAGHNIVSLHLSSAVSGTFDSACQAQRQLEEGASQARIEVIDSRTTCAGSGCRCWPRRTARGAARAWPWSPTTPAAPATDCGSGSASTRWSSCAGAGGSAARRRGSGVR